MTTRLWIVIAADAVLAIGFVWGAGAATSFALLCAVVGGIVAALVRNHRDLEDLRGGS